MKTILVLGATGTVGAHLTRLLTEGGHAVRAATRTPEAYEGAGEATRLDLKDPSTWAGSLDGVDRVFVLSPPGHADQHALLAPFLSEVSGSARVDRVVTMTAQGVDASDAIPFRQLELLIERSGKRFVHLRPTWFAQNFHTFWGHGVREFDALRLPAADAKVAFVDARDIASAACAALTSGSVELDRAYEITGPTALTHGEAAVVLSEALGRTITYANVSDEAFREQLAPSGLSDDYIGALTGLFAGVRAGVASRVTEDVEVLTGRAPRDLEAYAREHVGELS